MPFARLVASLAFVAVVRCEELSDAEKDALQKEMLDRLTPHERQRYDTFLLEQNQRFMDNWYMKAGLFDPKAKQPLRPIVDLASHACSYLLEGGKCADYSTTEDALSTLVRGHAKQHHKDDQRAAHLSFCSKVETLLERSTPKGKPFADATAAHSHCDKLFAYGEGEGYIEIKSHFLQGPAKSS